MYAGIEIGSKGIKVTVIDVNNIRKGDFEVKDKWTDNVGIVRGVSIDGNLAAADINAAVDIVNKDYNRVKEEFKILDDNIFIVGSSGVAMAKNTNDLVVKIKETTQKDMEFIDAETEGKMLLKGCVPPKYYQESMILDIGGGNTKGGYVEVKDNEDVFVFFPLSLNYGTVTLTEAIMKEMQPWNDLSEYNNISFKFMPVVRQQIEDMYASSPVALDKEKVYFSGGAVWAFYTLFYGDAKESFNGFKLVDVLDYDAILKNNFTKFQELAETDKNVARVLKTYSQNYLISGNNILIESLKAMPNIGSKKLYFAKEGQVAWLVSYIADRSSRVRNKIR
jgi:exopolyphosphatase/pppGpp-phosphohydrolase